MANLKKEYILVPTTECPPGKDIVLGSIITKPFEPRVSLNAEATVPIPPDALRHHVEEDFKAVMGKHRGASLGVYTRFVSFLLAGGDFDFDFSRGETHTYHFDRLESEYFEPSVEYVRQSLQTPTVEKFIRDTGFRKDMYMVIGIKTAYGARLASTMSRGHSFGVKVGLGASSVGAPVEGGPKFSITSESKGDISYRSPTPFVFAYRLRRIQYTRWDSRLVLRDMTKGAAFSMSRSEGTTRTTTDSCERYAILAIGADAADIGRDYLKSSGEFKSCDGLDEDDGSICQCIMPILPD